MKVRKRTRGKRKRRKRNTLTVRLGLNWGNHSAPDPPGLEAPRTQANAGPEVPCPSSQPQDSRVNHGEGGPLPQVTWRHLTWSIVNPLPPVLVPRSRPPREAVRPDYQEAPERTEEEEKAKHRLEWCGLALSQVFFRENFDSRNAWVQSCVKGAEAGKLEQTAGKFYGEAKDTSKCAEDRKIGVELWQVKSGTIFDNWMTADDPDEAKAAGEARWAVTKDAERKMKDEQDEVERTKAQPSLGVIGNI